MSTQRNTADPADLAKELARGEFVERVFPDMPAEVRERIASVVRGCGERILDLEENRARLEETLVDLRMAVRSYTEVKRKLREENEGLKAAVKSGRTSPVIGADAGLSDVMRLIDKVVDTPLPVLITGESGTGKEVIAHYIHSRGPRAEGPFVAINCGALPETLLESELFGIERGVATGVNERAGKFQQAHGGTLFLDEVADMTPAMQVKILRALQEREVERVGGRRSIAFDVRIISATNRDVRAEVAAKRFREDLFYRLVGVHMHLPPLRERRGDIDALLDYYLETSAKQFNRRVSGFSLEARRALRTYDWPGNVRELAVEVQRAVAVAEEETVQVHDLTPHIAGGARGHAGEPALEVVSEGKILPLREVRRLYERAYIERVLQRAGGSQRRAANLLGLTGEGLRKKLRALGITAGAAKAAAAAMQADANAAAIEPEAAGAGDPAGGDDDDDDA